VRQPECEGSLSRLLLFLPLCWSQLKVRGETGQSQVKIGQVLKLAETLWAAGWRNLLLAVLRWIGAVVMPIG